MNMKLAVASLITLVISGALHAASSGAEFVKKDVQYKFGIDVQNYHVRRVKTDFNTPNIVGYVNLAFELSADTDLYVSEKLVAYGGLGARINLSDFGSDNRKPNRDCGSFGDVSIIGQEFLSLIPFVGVKSKKAETPIYIELGFPYSEWRVATGDTFGSTCFENVQEEKETDLGQSIKLGLDYKHELYYLKYERFRNSIIDVDVWSIGASVKF